MGIVNDILGPKSKSNKGLPYTYEAKVPCWEGSDEYNSYIADTVCGVIAHLNKKT